MTEKDHCKRFEEVEYDRKRLPSNSRHSNGHTQHCRKVYSGIFGQVQCKFFFMFTVFSFGHLYLVIFIRSSWFGHLDSVILTSLMAGLPFQKLTVKLATVVLKCYPKYIEKSGGIALSWLSSKQALLFTRSLSFSLLWRHRKTGLRYTKFECLISYTLTGTFSMKNCARRENCDSRAWWMRAVLLHRIQRTK